ncbi:MAG: DegT/DnrJ/EryC1/StrS aminotransferase family protein [bacterium]
MNKFIPIAEPCLNGNELKYITECIKTGWVSSTGSYVVKFEEEFSKFCNARYGIACSNGTAALHLALTSLEIGNHDEVIVPIFTFIATANVVTYTGAKPVFVDCRRDTWNIDTEKIEEKITEKTKAIIPVHLYGEPVDMEPILKIAKKYNLYVIEDACESHGAKYQGKMVGTIGNVGCFSFYGNKIITTGEGGMVITDDEKITSKVKILRDHGMAKDKKYFHPMIGFNYRMTNLQSAIGVAQLEKIDKILQKKKEINNLYNSLLSEVKGIILQAHNEKSESVCWMYSVLIDEKSCKISRDELICKLKEVKIDTRPFFYPIHIMPPYKSNEKFPVAESISKQGISLPSSVNLTPKDIERIVMSIKKCIQR